ncbi:MAG: hypothetical protein WBA54_13700, partial [Acidaminobacteraceae bacterium]
VTSEEEDMTSLLKVYVQMLPEVIEYKVVVNNLDEYKFAKELGYKNVFVNLEKLKSKLKVTSEEALIKVLDTDLAGLLVSIGDYEDNIIDKLSGKSLEIYVDNVDDEDLYTSIIEKGYTGIFTNDLYIRN